jgi:uncharacterized protein DUF2017
MNVKRLDDRTVGVLGLDSILCELLHQIVPSADPGDDPNANSRIFASPSGGTEPEFDAEWRSYVEPGLRELFQSHLDVVTDDLRPLPRRPQEEPCSLAVPVAHLDHWLGALNQARLALASRYHLTEEEMESIPAIDDQRGVVLFQVHLYAFLQECFLRELGH